MHHIPSEEQSHNANDATPAFEKRYASHLKHKVVTNVPEPTPVQVVQRNKSLAAIERGFRVLNSEIQIAPMYLRLPERSRATRCRNGAVRFNNFLRTVSEALGAHNSAELSTAADGAYDVPADADRAGPPRHHL